MSILVVAKKEFKDSIRSKLLLGLIVAFVAYIGFDIYSFFGLGQENLSGDQTAINEARNIINNMSRSTALLLPIIGTLVGYKAIGGERESGRLNLLLSLPHTRKDIVFGKLLGRSAVLAVAVLVSFIWGGIILIAVTGIFPISRYAIFTIVTILIGVVFVSIAIAFSTAVRSQTRATQGAVGLVALFIFGWGTIVFIITYISEQVGLTEPPSGAPPWWEPPWLQFLPNINPKNAYLDAVTAAMQGFPHLSGVETEVNPLPFYLQPWFGFVILVFWLTVPILIANHRFQNTDL